MHVYRSHKDRVYLINQQTNHDKLYDHNIFIEPELARSLHLRDIQSGIKSQNQQSVNQADWKQKCLNLLHSRKVRIPCASDMQNQPLNFKEDEIPFLKNHLLTIRRSNKQGSHCDTTSKSHKKTLPITKQTAN